MEPNHDSKMPTYITQATFFSHFNLSPIFKCALYTYTLLSLVTCCGVCDFSVFPPLIGYQQPTGASLMFGRVISQCGRKNV